MDYMWSMLWTICGVSLRFLGSNVSCGFRFLRTPEVTIIDCDDRTAGTLGIGMDAVLRLHYKTSSSVSKQSASMFLLSVCMYALCGCTRVCIYIYMYVCMNIYIYIYINTHTY